MRPAVKLLLPLGILGVSVGVYYLLRQTGVKVPELRSLLGGGGTLLMFMNDAADSQHEVFVNASRQSGQQLGVTPVGVSSAQDILNAISAGPETNAKVVMLMHGSSEYLGRVNNWGVRRTGGDALPRYMSVETFANALAPRVTGSSIISFGACLSDAIAQAVRDALVRRGVTGSGEIRAKTTAGRTRANPNGIAFPLQAGAPGRVVDLGEAGPASIAWTTLTD